MDPKDSNQNSRYVINTDDTIIEQEKNPIFQKNFWNKDLELNIKHTHCVPWKTYKQQSVSRYILVKLQNVNDK